MVSQFALVCLLGFLSGAFGNYYLPGVTPNYFQQGQGVSCRDPYRFTFVNLKVFLFLRNLQVALKANKVTSTKTPVQYEYYDLPFCKKGRSKSKAENLGERLTGDTVTNSPYDVRLCIKPFFPPVFTSLSFFHSSS